MATSSFSKLWGRPHAPAPASTTSSSQSATLPPSPERHPKPAHQRQCSSPSFVETYARYVERLRRDEKLLEQGAGIQREGGPTIKALFPREQEVEERSPDTRKDTTDSSYSSWPASASPSRAHHSTRRSAEFLPSSPASRLRRSSESCLRPATHSSQSSSDAQAGGGTVAAAVQALETRCTWGSGETDPGRTLQIPSFSALHAAAAPSPSSPWPELEYEPEFHPEPARGDTPRRQYDVEVLVVPPGGDGAEVTAPPTPCNIRMAQVFEETPYLREQLVGILRSCPEDSALKMQVRELLKDHMDLVELLNAEFSKHPMRDNDLRQALYSTASMRIDRGEGRRQPTTEIERRTQGYTVVMRGLNTSQVTGIQQDQRQGNFNVQSWGSIGKLLVPPPDKLYIPWCTFIVIVALCCIFFFMGGGYATYLDSDTAATAESYTPNNLQQWLRFSAGSGHTFDFNYLLLWGGQYLPAIHQGQGWRWVTAAFLHVSFQHLLANLLLFAVLGGMLECRYGTLRMLVVAVLSTLGAAFFAGAFEDQCTQVVGASGAVMGFVGLTLADLVVNSGSVISVLLRLAIITAAAVFLIVTAVTKAGAYTSTWSHLGGFVCGLFPSFLFIPDFSDARWHKAQKLAAKLGVPTKSPEKTRGQEGVLHVAAHAESGGHSVAPGHSDEVSTLNPMLPFAERGLYSHQGLTVPEAIQEEECAAPREAVVSQRWQPHGLFSHRSGMSRGPDDDSSPTRNENHPVTPLFTEAHSDGGALGHQLAPIRTRTRAMAMLRQLSRCRSGCCCRWRPSCIPLHFVLGALVLVGVFSALPTYIYVVRLPETHCPTT